MDLEERLYHAREEYIKQTQPYINMLYELEMCKTPVYLYDTSTNELTRIEDKPTVYEIWVKERIEEIKVSTYKLFNIIVDYES